MTLTYIVEHEFVIKGSKIIRLDRNRPLSRDNNLTFTMNGKIYPYKLTHNLQLIIVDSMDKFVGNTIEFNGNISEDYAEIKGYGSAYKDKF